MPRDCVVITNRIPKTSVGKFDKIAIKKNIQVFLEKAGKINRDRGDEGRLWGRTFQEPARLHFGLTAWSGLKRPRPAHIILPPIGLD